MFLFLLILLNIFSYVHNYEGNLLNYISIVDENVRKVEMMNEHKSKVLVFFPVTDYDDLNDIIFKKMESYVSNFRKSIMDPSIQPDFYYTLNIDYQEYSYLNYLSYVFYIETYVGGAHPNHEIWTVNYDKKGNKVIGIYDLIEKNSNILNVFSSLSRRSLLYNEKIVDSSMMMEGTRPSVDNFSNFVFSQDGIPLFFPQYQVAPYSSGAFVVKVRYDELF